MKVKELIRKLEEYGEDTEVFVVYADYGVGDAGGDITQVFKSGNAVIIQNDLPIPSEFFIDKTAI